MTTATINVTLRLDKNLKEQADEFFNNLGLSLNSAINMFIRQSLRERQLPFLPSLNTPNAETRAALDEADRMLKVELGRGRGISNLDKKARITRPAPLI